ncbi:hypothetical protein KR044_011438 [Drosophila immigrans]|nr:hypothetical protein KR044_011438 [Drosophila immigrans]
MNRSSLLLVLLLGATLVCLASSLGLGDGEGNDYTWGAKLTTSTLIAREIVSKRKTLLQTTSKTYTLTQSGTAKNIDYIRITDLKRMRGATAEITSGGVNSDSVTVKFTSARGSGIKSQIEIWGT